VLCCISLFTPSFGFELRFFNKFYVLHTTMLQRLRCNVLKRGDDDGITLENMKVLVASESLLASRKMSCQDVLFDICFCSFRFTVHG
jgi:hypothetical protein